MLLQLASGRNAVHANVGAGRRQRFEDAAAQALGRHRACAAMQELSKASRPLCAESWNAARIGPTGGAGVKG